LDHCITLRLKPYKLSPGIFDAIILTKINLLLVSARGMTLAPLLERLLLFVGVVKHFKEAGFHVSAELTFAISVLLQSVLVAYHLIEQRMETIIFISH
jgi:hypothetical protein